MATPVFSLNFRGIREAGKALRSLDSRIGNKVLRKATNAAMNPIVKAARAQVGQDIRGSFGWHKTGKSSKFITKKVKRYRERGYYGVVGAQSKPEKSVVVSYHGKLRKHDPAKISHLLELGHAVRFGKNRPVVGRAKGKHSLKRAADIAAPAAIRLFWNKFYTECNAETRKARSVV